MLASDVFAWKCCRTRQKTSSSVSNFTVLALLLKMLLLVTNQLIYIMQPCVRMEAVDRYAVLCSSFSLKRFILHCAELQSA